MSDIYHLAPVETLDKKTSKMAYKLTNECRGKESSQEFDSFDYTLEVLKTVKFLMASLCTSCSWSIINTDKYDVSYEGDPPRAHVYDGLTDDERDRLMEVL